jgi:hypothetical protein
MARDLGWLHCGLFVLLGFPAFAWAQGADVLLIQVKAGSSNASAMNSNVQVRDGKSTVLLTLPTDSQGIATLLASALPSDGPYFVVALDRNSAAMSTVTPLTRSGGRFEQSDPIRLTLGSASGAAQPRAVAAGLSASKPTAAARNSSSSSGAKPAPTVSPSTSQNRAPSGSAPASGGTGTAGSASKNGSTSNGKSGSGDKTASGSSTQSGSGKNTASNSNTESGSGDNTDSKSGTKSGSSKKSTSSSNTESGSVATGCSVGGSAPSAAYSNWLQANVCPLGPWRWNDFASQCEAAVSAGKSCFEEAGAQTGKILGVMLGATGKLVFGSDDVSLGDVKDSAEQGAEIGEKLGRFTGRLQDTSALYKLVSAFALDRGPHLDKVMQRLTSCMDGGSDIATCEQDATLKAEEQNVLSINRKYCEAALKLNAPNSTSQSLFTAAMCQEDAVDVRHPFK